MTKHLTIFIFNLSLSISSSYIKFQYAINYCTLLFGINFFT